MFEIMIAWFPILRFTVLTLVLGFAIYLFRQKHTKTATVLTLLIIVIAIFAPIKIDGTNTKQYHQESSKQRTQEYKEVSNDRIIVHQKKPTFSERMQLEQLRSDRANANIQKELK